MTWLAGIATSIGLKGFLVIAIIGACLAALAGARNAGRTAEIARRAIQTAKIRQEQSNVAANFDRSRSGLTGRLRSGDF